MIVQKAHEYSNVFLPFSEYKFFPRGKSWDHEVNNKVTSGLQQIFIAEILSLLNISWKINKTHHHSDDESHRYHHAPFHICAAFSFPMDETYNVNNSMCDICVTWAPIHKHVIALLLHEEPTVMIKWICDVENMFEQPKFVHKSTLALAIKIWKWKKQRKRANRLKKEKKVNKIETINIVVKA